VVRRIPIQLMKAGWGSVLLAGVALAWRRLPLDGGLFLLTLGGYALGRFAMQPWRASRQRVGPVDLQQALSALLATTAIGGFVLKKL
jgi:prolipoprotein diacylglyceryltransferase